MKKILLTLLVLVSCLPAWSQFDKVKKSYNFERAIEELENGNTDAAEEFLKKELADNKKNSYAYYLMGVLKVGDADYFDAFKNLNNAIKYVPKKDRQSGSIFYYSRGMLHALTGDTIQAYADLADAIRLNPDNDDIYNSRGQLYYEQDRYEDSDKDYHHLIKMNPASIMGYMGLGRNEAARGNHENAIKYYNKVIKLDPEYSSGYSFRADSYLQMEKYPEAADDVMKALSIDWDSNAHASLQDFPKSQLPLLIAKMKGMAAKDPSEAAWPYYMAQVYKNWGMNKEAVESLKKAYELDEYPGFLEMMVECYRDMGDYSNALKTLNEWSKEIDDEGFLGVYRADILGLAGDIEGAIAELTRFIELNPDFSYGYYRRGFYEDNDNRTDAALDDYNMTVTLDPEYAYAWLGKGDMHIRRGERDLAMEAYSKVVALDSVPETNSCAMYALLALGRNEEAVTFMEKVISGDPDDAGNYYDGACFYSRLGDLDKSLVNLRTSLEKGFRSYHHIMSDDDLEALRQTEGFKALMKEYDNFSDTELPAAEDVTEVAAILEDGKGGDVVEIPMTPENGTYSVTCSVNELPLKFVFDTGASTVSISQVEANFMLKNGYLKKDDFVGTGRFVDANGNVTEGSVINLRNVEFGGVKLSNVKASVVRNQKAPLLLGQSVLSKLGKIEIDNKARKLIIKKK